MAFRSALWCNSTDGVAGPGVSLDQATHSLTGRGRLCHEVLAAGKPLSGVLLHCPFLEVRLWDWGTATWLENTNSISGSVRENLPLHTATTAYRKKRSHHKGNQ